MGYGRTSYRGSYRSTSYTAGRVARVNGRPGPCRTCGEEIPAGAGLLYREHGGAWSAVHTEPSQGGWLMDPQPVRGGCPADTDKSNAESHAAGFFGPDAPLPVSERDEIAARARRYAESNPASDAPRRRSYAHTSNGARMYERCGHEDYPCCGCGE
jgi:hypothetical protein